MKVQETTTEILCAKLDNIRHNPCIEPIVTKVADFEHSVIVLKGFTGYRYNGIPGYRHVIYSRNTDTLLIPTLEPIGYAEEEVDALGAVTVEDVILAVEPVVELQEEGEIWFWVRPQNQIICDL